MRVVVCDPNVAFAQSLAHVFQGRGASVVAVVQRLTEASIVIARKSADLCVVTIADEFEIPGEVTANLKAVTARLPVVLLAPSISPTVRALSAAAGVRGLGELRQGMSEVLTLVDRVHRGETVLDAVGRMPVRVGADVRDSHRLAAFLSRRERSVLSALVRGEDTGAIARQLGISRTTARGHIQGILTKLGTHSRVGAVAIAVREELVDAQDGEWLV